MMLVYVYFTCLTYFYISNTSICLKEDQSSFNLVYANGFMLDSDKCLGLLEPHCSHLLEQTCTGQFGKKFLIQGNNVKTMVLPIVGHLLITFSLL